MKPVRLKLAIQAPDGSLSNAADAVADQISARGLSFTLSEHAFQWIGLSPEGPFGGEKVVMFIYLQPDQLPVRAIGAVACCRRETMDPAAEFNVSIDFQEVDPADQKRIQKHLDLLSMEAPEQGERRRQLRRQSDLFIRELAHVLEILANLSEGRREAFGEQFSKLAGIQNPLGRREDDRRLGNKICFLVERLACNLARMAGTEAGLRKVRLRKVTGKTESAVSKNKILEGWEESPPKTGRNYCLYLEGGGIFRSARITQVKKDHFQTKNSLYEIEVIRP